MAKVARSKKKLLKTIHTWIGIIAGLFLSVIALTGSLILFRGEFERAALPKNAAAGNNSRRASLDDAARAVAIVRPESHIRRVRISTGPDDPYIVQIQSSGKRTERIVADASSGEVLGFVQPSWVDWMVDLHRNLLAGPTGRGTVGAFGIVLFVLSATGILMWLTGPRNWRAWISVRRRGSATRFNYELHRASGLWAYAFLGLISFTGIELAYPNGFRDAVQSMTGKPATVRAPRDRRAVATLSLDEYVRRGRSAMPDGVPVELRLPESGKGPVDLRLYRAGETRTLNATLRVGAVSSNVTVMEAAPNLELTTSEVGGVIHSSQTNALPVNGRYWASLMALIPGAVSSGTGTQDAIRFAGLSQEDNNFRFDGVDATGLNHQFVKEPARLQFPLESIAEFKASSAVYSADVGGMAGGQVSMVSKGGSNEFHGSAYEYLRNSFFDAKAFDSPAVAPFRMNNFGASFGGPIIRNKLFFFTNYEAVRQVFSQQVSGFVPTDAYRAQVIQKSPTLAPLINAFPKGTIPSADPNALLWISSGRNPTSEDSGLFRIDYAQSSATTISLRFNTDAYRTSSVALAESTFTTMDPPNAVLDVQHSFSPTILNDARIGFNRDNYVDVGDGKTPYSVSITGFAGYSLGDHSSRIDNSYSFVDNATFSHGRHTIKAGVEIRRMQENKLHPNSAQSLSYLKEADFINNVLDSYSYSAPGVETQGRKNPYYGYILDEFKLRPNLTLNAGLRYEYYGVDYDKNNIGLVFDPYTCGLQYCAPGTSFYFPNKHDFGPRVSIAWAPEALHGKTAIRAGAGIFYSDGQFGGLYAAQTNIGQNFSLTQKNVPGLTFPVTPFLGAVAVNVSYSGKDRHRKDIAVDEWNFSIQQEVVRDTILQVGYLGTKGSHLFRKGLLLNGIDPVTGKRPYASLTTSTIGWTVDDANSSLQALQVSLRRNLRTGLLISANYQWAQGISDGSNGGGESDTPENMNCRSCERGNTDFDIRHNFTTSAIWMLPVGRGHQLMGNAPPLMNTLFGGWQLSGIGTARTGLPLNVTLSRSASALPDGINGGQRPDVVPGQSLYPANQTPNLWLNPFAFTTPASGAWGNAGRNIVNGPGIWQADVSLEKRFPVRERVALSVRADVFNVFNRAQIGNPSVKWTDPTQGTTFGAITTPYTTSAIGTGTPRQMQFMLRLSF